MLTLLQAKRYFLDYKQSWWPEMTYCMSLLKLKMSFIFIHRINVPFHHYIFPYTIMHLYICCVVQIEQGNIPLRLPSLFGLRNRVAVYKYIFIVQQMVRRVFEDCGNIFRTAASDFLGFARAICQRNGCLALWLQCNRGTQTRSRSLIYVNVIITNLFSIA